MKFIYYMTWVFGFFFLIIEYARRGIDYFAINASTMIEDSVTGLIFLVAAFVYRKHKELGAKLIIGVWAFATGGMLVPFIAHLEAYIRGATFRPDHIHTDVNSIILKGIVWLICLVTFIYSVKKSKTCVCDVPT